MPHHHRSSSSDRGRWTCRGTASSDQRQQVLPNQTQSLPGLWPPADLFNLNFYFIRKILPHHSTPSATPDSARLALIASCPLGSPSPSRTHWKLHENHGCWYALCTTSCSLAHRGHTECTPRDRSALHAPVTGRSEKAG